MRIATLIIASTLISATVSQAQDFRINLTDIDLSTPEGVQTFETRLARQARLACTGTGSRLPNGQCVQAFRAEVMSQLSPTQREEHARVRSRTDTARAAARSAG
ncbi:hypothetical protein IP78_04870 [Brevundimonas sp. AAP58]|uniref:UrcA family protein n=1 Tax=Brevundimonas sp. AAP58 TaxID=1523422 RepID=UPI0006B939AB|nr:UrcA family protein [Brevundimonas sp. AAP58]KPF81639.1 hypothetical protein IP78_04870 [Brevundimonas sp. AAP58]